MFYTEPYRSTNEHEINFSESEKLKSLMQIEQSESTNNLEQFINKIRLEDIYRNNKPFIQHLNKIEVLDKSVILVNITPKYMLIGTSIG